MGAAIFPPQFASFAGQSAFPATRGPMVPLAGVVLARQRLATDSIGTATITFSGVHANSEIRVFLPDGTEVAGIESCSDDQALSWSYYVAGSANNTVTIRIVHLDYEILDFEYTTQQTAVQSIPVQQRLDGWYSNP